MPQVHSKVESSKPELTNQDRDKMFRSLQYTIAGMVCSFSILLPQNSSLMQNVLPHYSSNEVGIFLSRLGGLGSFVEFIINPVLGRLGDSIGRKPILLVALSSNFLLRLSATLNSSSIFFLTLNSLLSRAFDTVIFTTVRAAVSDLYSGEDVAAAMPRLGIAAGLSVILGPIFSVLLKKITGSSNVALLLSTLITAVNTGFIYLKFEETLIERNIFSWRDASPFGFLELLSKSGTMLKLMLTSWLQTFTDGRNIVDTQFAYQRDQLSWTADMSGAYVGLAGVKILFGGVIGKLLLIPRLGIRYIGTFSNIMNALGGLSFTFFPKYQVLVLLLTAFGDRKRDGVEAMINTLGVKYGFGKGQTMAQLFNMRSTANVLAPLLYSSMYEYGLSVNKPSLLPLTFCAISLFAELVLQSISKKEMDTAIVHCGDNNGHVKTKANLPYEVGDVVFAKAIGWRQFYKGKIEKLYTCDENDTGFIADVIFDDGERAKKLRANQIKKKK